MEEWKLTKIGSICKKVCSGGTPKSTVKEYYGGGIPWLNTKEVHFNRIYSTESTITDKGLNNCAAKWIEANAVIIAMYGATAAKCAIGMIPMTTNQACCNLMIDKKKADYRFVYYAIANSYSILASLANGGAQQNLNAQVIKDFEILLPSLVVQKRAADVLSTLDDKIECNRRINDNFPLSLLLLTCFILWLLKLRNDNLNQQARALYKSWLVDFEPFLNGEFAESELGMIPKGWKVGKLFDVAEVLDKYRKPLSGQERDLMDKIYPYYGATSCMDYVDDYLFDGIYTLIGEDGSVVKEDGLPYMQYVWGKLWVNNHAHILQGKNGFSTEMLHVMLSTTNIRHLVTGAVQAKLSQANMQKILVAIPSTNILDEIRPKFDKLYQLIRKNEDESHRLSQLRDALLPRLMSGVLKISDLTI